MRAGRLRCLGPRVVAAGMGVPPRREGTLDYGRKKVVASTSRPRRACELASANLMAVSRTWGAHGRSLY